MIEKWTNGPAGFLAKANSQLSEIENGLKLTGDRFINVRTSPAGKSVSLNLAAAGRYLRKNASEVKTAQSLPDVLTAQIAAGWSSESNQENYFYVNPYEPLYQQWQPDKVYQPADKVSCAFEADIYGLPHYRYQSNYQAKSGYVYTPENLPDWDPQGDYSVGDKVRFYSQAKGMHIGYRCKNISIADPAVPPPQSPRWTLSTAHAPVYDDGWEITQERVYCFCDGADKLQDCLPRLNEGDIIFFKRVEKQNTGQWDYYCIWRFTGFLDHSEALW